MTTKSGVLPTNRKGKMNYAFEHQGKAYTPDGEIIKALIRSTEHNLEVERKELEGLRTAPDKVFLYATIASDISPIRYFILASVHTWLGTSLDAGAKLGPRRHIGFGRHTYRRHVTCRIFGTLYHGWFMESSGSYCRLRKAKHG